MAKDKNPHSDLKPVETPPPLTSSDSDADLDFAKLPGAQVPNSDSNLDFDHRGAPAAPAPDSMLNYDLTKLPGAQVPSSDSDLDYAIEAKLPSAKPDDSSPHPAAGFDSVSGSEVFSLVPPSASASSSDLFGSSLPLEGVEADSGIPDAVAAANLDDPKSGIIDIEMAPAAGASSSNLFGSENPQAQPVAADSASSKPESLAAVHPSSGWFDSHEDQQAPVAEAIEANLAGPASGGFGGSDIFAGPVPPAVPKSDVSDVIAATAYSTAKPAADSPSARKTRSRSSDIALNFDRPPGGSTVTDANADADLPVADELADSLFGGEEQGIDSDRLAGTPNLPGDHADLGGTPPGSVDASSILADLSAPGSAPGDSSAIRLEAPGMEATLRDDERYDFDGDGTEADLNVPEASGDPNDWHAHSGSDLFADRTRSEFELLPDAGEVDPFADDLTADQPSLSTAPSSIFSGSRPAGLGSGSGHSSGSVPVANPESTDSVEFSDHPDPNAADSGSFHAVPAGAGTGAVDFDMTHDPHPERSMRMEMPEEEDDWNAGKSGPASGILSRRKQHDSTDEMAPMPATPVKGRPAAPIPVKKESSMEMNWVAGSLEDDAPLAPKSRPSELRAPRERSSEPAVNQRGMIGVALGLLLGVGISIGAYFSGVVPNKEDSKPNRGATANGTSTQVPTPATATAADAHAALNAGDPAKAVKVMETVGATTPADKAALGQARLFSRFRELAQTNAAVNADDAAIKKARTELEAAMNDADAAKTPDGEKVAVRATLHLGLTYEVAGDRAGAQKVYSLGKTKFPKSADAFQAALDRMAATNPDANKTSLRLAPAEAEQLASAAVILLALNPVPDNEKPAPAVEEPAEAGAAFWKAVNLAAAGSYDDAIKQIVEAKKAHEKRAKALAGRGLNPLSDPLEQIFPRSCDDLKAYWELRKALYEHPGVGAAIKKDGVAKTLDALAAAEKRAVDQTMLAADLKKSNETLASGLKVEKDKAAVAEKLLATETEKSVKLDKELKAERANALKVEKDLKAMLDKLAVDFKKELADVKKLDADLLDASKLDIRKREQEIAEIKDRLTVRQAAIDAIAKDLQAGKLLPEKFDNAALIAAARSAVSRATGPDLSKLIPTDLTAIAGVPIATGHLLDLAARAIKADAAIKASAAELAKLKTDSAAEVKKLNADRAAAEKALNDSYKADLKKLNDEHAVAMKKLTDAQAVELKKAADATNVATDKLKAEQAAKLKELSDKYALDAKKLSDAHAEKLKDVEADARKQADALAVKVKGLEGDLVLEKGRVAEAERRLKSLGGAAVVASQELDRQTLQAAARHLDAGIAAYRSGRYATAENALEEAAKHDPNDAIAWYYLGATRWAQGKIDEAKADYKQGADREKQRLVPAKHIDAAIGQIQGAARDALTAARP